MRQKEMKLVVTFHTTTAAMIIEKALKEQGVKGRLIPVPRVITAGCGMCWCSELSEREAIEKVMKQEGIEENEIHQCMV